MMSLYRQGRRAEGGGGEGEGAEDGAAADLTADVDLDGLPSDDGELEHWNCGGRYTYDGSYANSAWLKSIDQQLIGVPVIAGLPVGHGRKNHAFPWGGSARIAQGSLSW